jgi:hypothetical protein
LCSYVDVSKWISVRLTIVGRARDDSVPGLVRKEQASEVSVVEVADTGNSKSVLETETPFTSEGLKSVLRLRD